jgi:hypothetical protein
VAGTVARIQMALAKNGEKNNSFSEVNLVLPAKAMGCSPYGSGSAPELFSWHERTTLFSKSKI